MTIAEKKPEEKTPGEIAREGLPSVTIHGLHDAKCLMKAAEWRGKQNIKVVRLFTLLPGAKAWRTQSQDLLAFQADCKAAEQAPAGMHR